MPNSSRYAVFTSSAAVLAAFVVACVSAPEPGERGFEPYMAGMTAHEPAWRQLDDDERHLLSDRLLERPLDIDGAAKVALLNHPRAQADIRRIELTEAELRQEAALGNPELEAESFLWGNELRTAEVSLLVDVATGLQQRSRIRAATQGIEASRAKAAEDLIGFIYEVQHHWIDAVAAAEHLQRVQDVIESHRTMSEAAELHHDAGTIADDELHRIQVEARQAELLLKRAEDRAYRSRVRLQESLGVDDDQQWSIPDELPDVPGRLPVPDDAEKRALTQSAGLEQLHRQSEFAAAQLRAERWGGAFPEIAVGAITDWDIDGGQWQFGPAFRLQLPIFDRRSPARDALRAEQVILDFESRELMRKVESDLRSAIHRLETAQESAHHYGDEVLPLRQQTVDDALEQYNAMTISALDLLDIKRQQLEAQREFVDIRRQFWQAKIEVDRLISGGSPP